MDWLEIINVLAVELQLHLKASEKEKEKKEESKASESKNVADESSDKNYHSNINILNILILKLQSLCSISLNGLFNENILVSYVIVHVKWQHQYYKIEVMYF